MPTTRRTTPPPGDPEPRGVPAASIFDAPASEDFNPVDLPTGPGDPRADALAALLQPPAVTVSDIAPPPPLRPAPVPTGKTVEWVDKDGVRCLVASKRYPRMWPINPAKDDVMERREAHTGDIAVLPDDDHTRRDIRYGYLIPQD